MLTLYHPVTSCENVIQIGISAMDSDNPSRPWKYPLQDMRIYQNIFQLTEREHTELVHLDQ